MVASPPSPAMRFIDRYADAYANATRVFGDPGRAVEWLFEPSRFLGGDAPVDWLHSDEDAGLIRDFLGQIEYGVYL